MYFIEKNITRFYNYGHTYFLDPVEINKVKAKLTDYNIYSPYKDSEKNILYKKTIPEVILYKIKSKIEIRHQDILGTLYSLNISSDLFGDIVKVNGDFYVYILPIVRNYFESNFLKIKNSSIELIEVDINELSEFEREYQTLTFIVSSNRIDNIISSIVHCSRSKVDTFIKRKDIMLNYEFIKKGDYKLKSNDIFSIKKIGKFKFEGIIKKTKGDHLIVRIYKYK